MRLKVIEVIVLLKGVLIRMVNVYFEVLIPEASQISLG